MKECVFQKIVNDLFDERGVHGNHDKDIRYGNMDRNIHKAFSEPSHCGRDDLLQRLVRLDHIGHTPLILDPGNGEEIFHHGQKPLRILLNVLDQFVLFIG